MPAIGALKVVDARELLAIELAQGRGSARMVRVEPSGSTGFGHDGPIPILDEQVPFPGRLDHSSAQGIDHGSTGVWGERHRFMNHQMRRAELQSQDVVRSFSNPPYRLA